MDWLDFSALWVIVWGLLAQIWWLAKFWKWCKGCVAVWLCPQPQHQTRAAEGMLWVRSQTRVGYGGAMTRRRLWRRKRLDLLTRLVKIRKENGLQTGKITQMAFKSHGCQCNTDSDLRLIHFGAEKRPQATSLINYQYIMILLQRYYAEYNTKF